MGRQRHTPSTPLVQADPSEDRRVVMAAYGDYGPGYIGTARSYAEGGYETESRSSFVDPSVENVLIGAMKRLMDRRK